MTQVDTIGMIGMIGIGSEVETQSRCRVEAQAAWVRWVLSEVLFGEVLILCLPQGRESFVRCVFELLQRCDCGLGSMQ